VDLLQSLSQAYNLGFLIGVYPRSSAAHVLRAVVWRTIAKEKWAADERGERRDKPAWNRE
jgi:hypothetical protein